MGNPSLVDVIRTKESIVDKPKKKFIRVTKLSEEKKAKLARTLMGVGSHGSNADTETSKHSRNRSHSDVRKAMYGKD